MFYLVAAHPTARFCGLVHPSDLHGILGAGESTYHWGELSHLRFVG